MMPASIDSLIASVRASASESAASKISQSLPTHLATPSTAELYKRFVDWTIAIQPHKHSAEVYLLLEAHDFIEQAYRSGLKREPDVAAYHSLMAQLSAGDSRLAILFHLSRSDEAKAFNSPWRFSRFQKVLLRCHILLSRLGPAAAITARLLRLYEYGLAERLRIHSMVRMPELVTELLAPLSAIQLQQSSIQKDLMVLARAYNANATLGGIKESELAAYYVAFEDANRGSTEAILAKLGAYEDWVLALAAKHHQLPLLDIGCGRGEWLTLLRDRGVEATGIDLNENMVSVCQAQGLLAEHTHALAALRDQPDHSLSAITAFHVIEHLAFPYLYALVAESARTLCAGGSVLFETPNPENLLVGSHTFYHDFTHRNPVTPAAIEFLLRFHGFERIEIRRLNPYPAEAKVPGNDPLTERVNGHLCGPQDYAIIGYRPLLGAQ